LKPSHHTQTHFTERLWQSVPLLLLFLVASLVLIPLAVVLSSFVQSEPEVWAHLRQYVLPSVLWNTGGLLLGVGLGVLLLGVPLAWLTAVYEFPLRRWLTWGLMLPLAIPAYVFAFIAVGMLEYTSPLQTWLRSVGFEQGLPSVRNLTGASVILSFAFYPYVYLLARSAFLSQGQRLMEAGQMLGRTPLQAFGSIALPMARPWILGGLLLALMETLADFGAVSVFNVDTLTTTIYKSWFALFNLNAAAQLAGLLAIGVLGLLWLEQRARAGRQYSVGISRVQRKRLTGWQAWAATSGCLLVFTLAFVIPFAQLLWWSASVWQVDLNARYWGFASRSLLIAASAALLVTLFGLLLAGVRRQYPNRSVGLLISASTVGYAIPGAVLAVGVFIPLAWLDGQIVSLLRDWGFEGRQFLVGSVWVMLLALAIRFLAVAFQPIDSQMQRIRRSQEEAARLLGASQGEVVRRVHLPLLKAGLLTALLISFVEVMKEMPITLMTRSYGWDTLAVRVFEMTSEGMWERAALPSLLIVLVGLLPVVLLIRQTER